MPGQGASHQQGVDAVLGNQVVAGPLGGVDDLGARGQTPQQVARRQTVDDDDIGAGQQFGAARGNQTRLARPSADEGDPAAVDAVVDGARPAGRGHGRAPSSCGAGVRAGMRTAEPAVPTVPIMPAARVQPSCGSMSRKAPSAREEA